MNGNSIVGRLEVDSLDFYETPRWATEKVLDAMIADGELNKDDIIYEPCCGAGAISNVLESYGFSNVKKSDIQTEDYIVGEKGLDVYKLPDNCCDVVFTNPPYNLMTKENMLNEFLRMSNRKVVLLLNIYFLSSKSRKELLETSHLKHLYIHSDRVTMYPYGKTPPKKWWNKNVCLVCLG